MLINGKRPEAAHTDILVLRPGPKRIVFTAQAILDFTPFEKLVSEPTPPVIQAPGGITKVALTDPAYRKAIRDFAELRTNWLVIQSLKATDFVEWETVKEEEPDTWKNWRSELVEAKFSDAEQVRILMLVTEVNALDDRLLGHAREQFLAEALQVEK